jgi:hypothetical protein
MKGESINKILIFIGTSFLCSALILSCNYDYPTVPEYRKNSDSIVKYKRKLDSILKIRESFSKIPEVIPKVNEISAPDSDKVFINEKIKNNNPDSDVFEYGKINLSLNSYPIMSLKLSTKKKAIERLLTSKNISVKNLILQPSLFVFDFNYFKYRIDLLQKNSK